MQKIVNKLITSSIKGVDVYRWKDATWLIFTNETRWVVELTDEGTLWYNYRFFNDIFKYVSLECGKETEDYITQWVNDYFYRGIGKTEERGKNNGNEFEWYTRAVINNGIKEVNDSSSIHRKWRSKNLVPRIIKESIKNIYPDKSPDDYDWSDEFKADKVIKGGVKL